MGMLQSELFKDIARLQDCAERDPAHVMLKSPRERGPHVRAIQQALQDLDQANISATELNKQEYGEDTANAVAAYKNKRRIFGPGQIVADKIVGTGTIRKMDLEWLNSKQRTGRLIIEDTDSLKQDICMSFEGGTVTSNNTALTALAQRVNTAQYLRTHHPLKTFDYTTHYLARDKVVREVLGEVGRMKRQGIPIDRVLIRGFSSGGKIALMVANGLYTQLGLSCRYLCVGDAALDKDDPLFSGGPGIAACQDSINVYQLWGNNIDPSGEVHGTITGIKRHIRSFPCEQAAALAWNALDAKQQSNDAVRANAALNVHLCNDSVARTIGAKEMNMIMMQRVTD